MQYCALQVCSYYDEVVINKGLNTFLNLDLKCKMFHDFFQSPYTFSVTLLKVVKSPRVMQILNMFGPIVYDGNMLLLESL